MLGRDRLKAQLFGSNATPAAKTSVLPWFYSKRPYNYQDNLFLAYSPEVPGSAPLLAIADEQGRVSIRSNRWQGFYRRIITHTSTAHDNAIFHVAWPHSNGELLTGGGDSEIRLWQVVTSTR